MSDRKRKQKSDQPRDEQRRDQNESAKSGKEYKVQSGKDQIDKDQSGASKSGKEGKGKAGKKRPWYREGLQFECTQCGACCSGEPGYVWVDQDEIDAMSTEMGLEVDAFERKFVRQVGRDRSLIEYPDGDCILLDPRTRKCTVYHSRPTQCRTWPFWDSTVKKKRDWKETCEVCPGAGTGKLYTFEEIEVARKQKSV